MCLIMIMLIKPLNTLLCEFTSHIHDVGCAFYLKYTRLDGLVGTPSSERKRLFILDVATDSLVADARSSYFLERAQAQRQLRLKLSFVYLFFRSCITSELP